MNWQPIETAPIMTPILVTDGKVIVCVERGITVGMDWAYPVGFSGYEWEWTFEFHELTHWAPLPDMP